MKHENGSPWHDPTSTFRDSFRLREGRGVECPIILVVY